jgi:hypothetical protein
MNSVFSSLNFFATDLGILSIGAFAVVMILLWDWRASLIGLVLTQVGVATVAVLLQGMDPHWAIVQTLVVVLCSLILALSGNQTASAGSLHQAGTLFFRAMVLVLLYVCWRMFELEITIPQVRPEVSLLFLWLSICALLMLSLNNNPLFTGTALLLWCIPAQVVTSLLLPIPSLIVMIGVLQLLLALACSYLMLVEKYGIIDASVVATDVTFALKQLPGARDGIKLLPGPVRSGPVRVGEHTTLNLPAVNMSSSRPPARSDKQASERTGEHPLVTRLAKRKSGTSQPPSSASSSSTPPTETTPSGTSA